METRSKVRKRMSQFQESEPQPKSKHMKQSISETSTDNLNDDIWVIIFSYLTIPDLINIERVSKKWRELSLMSWMNVKKFNLESDIHKKYSLKILRNVLMRGGKYLTHLKVKESVLDKKFTPNSPFIDINKYCSNLTHLYLNLRSSRRLIYKLSKNIAEKLKLLHINLNLSRGNHDQELAALTKEAINVENFKISYCNSDCISLLNLTSKCKALTIKASSEVKNETLEKVLDNLPNIEHLDISFTQIQPETLKSVSNQLKSFNAPDSPSDSYKNLKFSNLRNLDLTLVIKCDKENILHTFIEKSPMLEKLKLFHLNLKQNHVNGIVRLEKLKYLDLSFGSAENEVLEHLAKSLENLEVFCSPTYWCIHSVLICFIKYCVKLRMLVTGRPDYLNHTFFKSADKLVRERLNDVSLTVKLDFKDVQGELKRLKLEPFNYENSKGSRLKVVRYRDKYNRKRLNENEPAYCVSTV